MQIFPFRTPVLRVDQPIGSFYVGVLPAKILLEVAFSDVMAAKARPDGSGYDLTGTQRLPQPKRLPQIAEYIDRADAAFPNTIILAGNYRADVLPRMYPLRRRVLPVDG
jgi:DGQHR domain-containing protein